MKKGSKHSLETKIKIGIAGKGRSPWHKGTKGLFHVSEETKKKISNTMKGCIPWNKHPDDKYVFWKSDSKKYLELHYWVRKTLGQPITCENCKKTNLKGLSIHWANKSHKYKRDTNDWIRLCSKCHALYDYGKIKL